MLYNFLIVYFLIISLISVFVTVTDKKRAIKNKSRVPEKTLFMLAFLGGAVAMLATMKLVRHKTKHKRFMIGIPLIIIFQILIIFSYIYLTR